MSLMLRLLSILLLSSGTLFAVTNSEMITFVKNQLKKNKSVTLKDVAIRDSFNLHNHRGWKVFIIDISGSVKQKNGARNFKSQDILFGNDTGLIAPDLIDIKSGASVKNSIAPTFKASFYKRENLIYGYANARHKMAVFSDPLCPFCIKLMPKLIKEAKTHPNKFALYYYHFPLTSIHPASASLVKCMVAAEQKGIKDVAARVYASKFDYKETNEKKILMAFNRALHTHLTIRDINAPRVLAHLQSDRMVAMSMLVNSTPTLFFDGKKDPQRDAYKKAR